MAQTIRDSLLREALDGRLNLIGITVDQYHRLIDLGTIPEDTSTELIDGLLVTKDRSKAGDDPMTIGDRHRTAVLRLERLIPQFEALGCFLQCQQPVALPPDDEPEPDISVIRGNIDDFAERRPGPGDVIFVLEVSDSSLSRDLNTKLRVYASAELPCYIVVNLQDNVVIVHTNPVGDSYQEAVRLYAGATLRLPSGGVEIVDIPVSKLI